MLEISSSVSRSRGVSWLILTYCLKEFNYFKLNQNVCWKEKRGQTKKSVAGRSFEKQRRESESGKLLEVEDRNLWYARDRHRQAE